MTIPTLYSKGSSVSVGYITLVLIVCGTYYYLAGNSGASCMFEMGGGGGQGCKVLKINEHGQG